MMVMAGYGGEGKSSNSRAGYQIAADAPPVKPQQREDFLHQREGQTALYVGG
jgi:hypothetical protein